MNVIGHTADGEEQTTLFANDRSDKRVQLKRQLGVDPGCAVFWWRKRCESRDARGFSACNRPPCSSTKPASRPAGTTYSSEGFQSLAHGRAPLANLARHAAELGATSSTGRWTGRDHPWAGPR